MLNIFKSTVGQPLGPSTDQIFHTSQRFYLAEMESEKAGFARKHLGRFFIRGNQKTDSCRWTFCQRTTRRLGGSQKRSLVRAEASFYVAVQATLRITRASRRQIDRTLPVRFWCTVPKANSIIAKLANLSSRILVRWSPVLRR